MTLELRSRTERERTVPSRLLRHVSELAVGPTSTYFNYDATYGRIRTNTRGPARRRARQPSAI